MNVVFSQMNGDVNGDGKVDISDVVKLVNIILGGSAGEEDSNGEAYEENGIYYGVYAQPAVSGGTSAITSDMTNNFTSLLNSAKQSGNKLVANTPTTVSPTASANTIFIAYPEDGEPTVLFSQGGSTPVAIDFDATSDGLSVTDTWNGKNYVLWELFNVNAPLAQSAVTLSLNN